MPAQRRNTQTGQAAPPPDDQADTEPADPHAGRQFAFNQPVSVVQPPHRGRPQPDLHYAAGDRFNGTPAQVAAYLDWPGGPLIADITEPDSPPAAATEAEEPAR